jgi:mannose-6-phosphate isomerase-like protein (cupin superfamily)
MIVGKVWGRTEPLLRTPFIDVQRLTILPHSRCSMHAHQFKWNAFLVLSGVLKIEVRKKSYDLIDVTTLGEGDFTTVPPGEYHRFLSGSEVVKAFEIYYPAELSEDIIRQDVGGMVERKTS